MNSPIHSQHVKQPPAARARRRLKYVGISLALLLSTCGGYALFRDGPAAPAVAATSDVPTTDGRAIVLTPNTKQRLGLKLEPVREISLSPVVQVAGTVDFDPRYVAAVGTRLQGLVRSVNRYEGDAVKRGELLATIDSPELGRAQADVLMFRAQLAAAKKDHSREQSLSERGLTTGRELEQSSARAEEYRSKLLAAEQRVSALGGSAVPKRLAGSVGLHELRAPLAGTVVERHIHPGQSVDGELTAFRVADLEHLWIELAVFERSLSQIRPGLAVELRPLASRSQTFEGQVAHVGEQIDPATRTAIVRVEVNNRARRLRPGQAVTATIRLEGAPDARAAVVPQAAITYVDGKPTVFVAETDLRIVATPVEIGETDGQHQQIFGVPAGQQVVTEGVFALKSELFR